MPFEQLGFAGAFLGSGIGKNRRLDAIDALIDWSKIEKVAKIARTGEWGRPPYSPLSMIKALLLQQWYNLSDPGLEEALSDRVSFRRFCGLSLDGGTPDETTICRFRQTLNEKNLGTRVFEEVLAQLDKQGMVVRAGTILDATLIESQVRPPRSKENGFEAKSKLDPDASWTRSGLQRKYFFGFKSHIATDKGTGLIRKVIVTTAKTYESQVADDLIMGDEAEVYADKAYEKKERRARLKEKGVKDRILHRSHKYQKELPKWQRVRNRLISKVRCQIEKTFGTFKLHYNLKRAKYRGLKAMQTHVSLVAAAFNLRRALNLLAT